jgi:hypothetical protein
VHVISGAGRQGLESVLREVQARVGEARRARLQPA